MTSFDEDDWKTLLKSIREMAMFNIIESTSLLETLERAMEKPFETCWWGGMILGPKLKKKNVKTLLGIRRKDVLWDTQLLLLLGHGNPGLSTTKITPFFGWLE